MYVNTCTCYMFFLSSFLPNTSRTERTVLNILSLRTPSPPSPTDIVSFHTHLNNRSSIITKMYDAYKSPW